MINIKMSYQRINLNESILKNVEIINKSFIIMDDCNIVDETSSSFSKHLHSKITNLVYNDFENVNCIIHNINVWYSWTISYDYAIVSLIFDNETDKTLFLLKYS